MFLYFRGLVAVAILTVGIAMLIEPTVAAELNQVIEIKVKQVIFYESADGKPAGRIARDQIALPLDIKEKSKNGRLLVNIGGKDLWIPKLLTVTDGKPAAGVTVSCQNITKSYATSRGFGDCN